MRIRRPSEYIRYTDAELSPEEHKQNEAKHLLITDTPVITLAKAAPIWGPSFDKYNG